MTNEKSARSWEDHWRDGEIPWDAGQSSPSLLQHLEKHPPAPGARALVPGCGSGYDVFELARAGYEAIGLDLAPSATARFEGLRKEANLGVDQAKLVTGDFFELDPEELGGPFDLVWDYTFYCAIEREQRDAWREQMAKLLKPGGTIIMLLFPVVPDAPEDQGPPFPLDPEKVEQRLRLRFERISLERAEKSHPGREGKEWLSVWQHRHS